MLLTVLGVVILTIVEPGWGKELTVMQRYCLIALGLVLILGSGDIEVLGCIALIVWGFFVVCSFRMIPKPLVEKVDSFLRIPNEIGSLAATDPLLTALSAERYPLAAETIDRDDNLPKVLKEHLLVLQSKFSFSAMPSKKKPLANRKDLIAEIRLLHLFSLQKQISNRSYQLNQKQMLLLLEQVGSFSLELAQLIILHNLAIIDEDIEPSLSKKLTTVGLNYDFSFDSLRTKNILRKSSQEESADYAIKFFLPIVPQISVSDEVVFVASVVDENDEVHPVLIRLPLSHRGISIQKNDQLDNWVDIGQVHGEIVLNKTHITFDRCKINKCLAGFNRDIVLWISSSLLGQASSLHALTHLRATILNAEEKFLGLTNDQVNLLYSSYLKIDELKSLTSYINQVAEQAEIPGRIVTYLGSEIRQLFIDIQNCIIAQTALSSAHHHTMMREIPQTLAWLGQNQPQSRVEILCSSWGPVHELLILSRSTDEDKVYNLIDQFISFWKSPCRAIIESWKLSLKDLLNLNVKNHEVFYLSYHLVNLANFSFFSLQQEEAEKLAEDYEDMIMEFTQLVSVLSIKSPAADLDSSIDRVAERFFRAFRKLECRLRLVAKLFFLLIPYPSFQTKLSIDEKKDLTQHALDSYSSLFNATKNQEIFDHLKDLKQHNSLIERLIKKFRHVDLKTLQKLTDDETYTASEREIIKKFVKLKEGVFFDWK